MGRRFDPDRAHIKVNVIKGVSKVNVRGNILEPIANKLVNLQNTFIQILLLRKIPSANVVNAQRLGTYYGGWWIPDTVTRTPNDFSFISCGLGHDVSFDSELIAMGIRVLGVEAEERFISEIRNSGLESQDFVLLHARVGINEPTEVNLQNLIDISREKFGTKRIGIKMDIEGAEYKVIFEALDSKSLPEILAFELDYMSLIPFLSFRMRIRRYRNSRKLLIKLANSGFRIYKQENWNLHFLRII